MEQVMKATAQFKPTYWEAHPGFNNLKEETTREVNDAANFVTIVPTLTMVDRAKVLPLLVELTKAVQQNEPGCLYYQMIFNGDQWQFREAYEDAAAAQFHLDNNKALIEQLLEKDVATLDSIQLHASPKSLERLKESFDALGAEYVAIDHGFSRYRK